MCCSCHTVSQEMDGVPLGVPYKNPGDDDTNCRYALDSRIHYSLSPSSKTNGNRRIRAPGDVKNAIGF